MTEGTHAGAEGAVDLPRELMLDAADLAARERSAFAPGVEYTVLWREGRNVAGLMWVAGGAVVAEHVHRYAEHHMWLVEGRARMNGRTLDGRGYAHVPPGVPHEIAGVEPHGCTFFYLYLTRSSPPDDA